MTLNYQEHIPPVGVDHIDYALKRANLAVRRILLKDAADIRIEKLHEVGPDLYLTVKRPVNPYAAAEDLDPEDRSQWVSIPRIHRRFSIQEVLDALAPNGLQVNDGETAVVDALAEVGINVAPEDIAIEVIGNTAHIKSIAKGSYMWWSNGTVQLIKVAPIQER